MASDWGKKETPAPVGRKRSRKDFRGTTKDTSEISLSATLNSPPEPSVTAPLIAPGYGEWLSEIKQRIRVAQIKAGLAVNRELVLLYWDIGRSIAAQQVSQGWGARVIDRLADDLRQAFPDLRGFSPRNLKYMRAFATAWPERVIVQQAAAQIPWFHNCLLLDKVAGTAAREWYIRQTIAHGWSRNVLALQIESRLHERQGRAVTNFAVTLPAPQSDLAQQVLKDPYLFDFLTLDTRARERELELGLLDHIQKFLGELGVGFALGGRQYRLEVYGEEFFLALLFYHLRRGVFVVVDLKMEAFQPEFAGKMNFYLSAVDDQLRHRDDQPTIGLLLCREKKRLIVEYALRDVKKPIGVAEWRTRLVESLPKKLQSSLPTIAQIEAELAGGLRLPVRCTQTGLPVPPKKKPAENPKPKESGNAA